VRKGETTNIPSLRFASQSRPHAASSVVLMIKKKEYKKKKITRKKITRKKMIRRVSHSRSYRG